jgi:hypothetical protein
MSERERIVAAAIRDHDGEVWSLPPPARHCDVLNYIYKQTGKPTIRLSGIHQGFATSTGRYLTRRQAEPVAREAGQIRRAGRLIGSVLTSEDLW